jgi:hypothetical protein
VTHDRTGTNNPGLGSMVTIRPPLTSVTRTRASGVSIKETIEFTGWEVTS